MAAENVKYDASFEKSENLNKKLNCESWPILYKTDAKRT